MKILKLIKEIFTEDSSYWESCEMVFDWELAARLIDRMRPYIAYEMLEDSQNTRKPIYQGGIPIRNKTVHSKTKRPMIIIDGKAPLPCFRIDREADEAETWTKEALKMLEGKI